MEHAQRERGFFVPQTLFCLNPYFNGTCSKRRKRVRLVFSALSGLNPYFNGTCSKSNNAKRVQARFVAVLILILMEHAQREINSTL